MRRGAAYAHVLTRDEEDLVPCSRTATRNGDLYMPLCASHGAPSDPLTSFRWVRALLRVAPEGFHARAKAWRHQYLAVLVRRHARELVREVKVGLIRWAQARQAAARGLLRPRCPGCGCGEGAACVLVAYTPAGDVLLRGECAGAGEVPGHVVCSGCVTAHDQVAGVEVTIPPGRYGARNAPAGPFVAPRRGMHFA